MRRVSFIWRRGKVTRFRYGRRVRADAFFTKGRGAFVAGAGRADLMVRFCR